MTFKETKGLIRSDYYRLRESFSFHMFIKDLIFNSSFKTTFWLRIGNYLNSKRNIEAFEATFVNRNTTDKKTLYATFNQFVARTFSILDRNTGIGWTTSGHSGDFVPVFAIGVGSELFNGFQDNTDLPNKIRSLCGINRHSGK